MDSCIGVTDKARVVLMVMADACSSEGAKGTITGVIGGRDPLLPLESETPRLTHNGEEPLCCTGGASTLTSREKELSGGTTEEGAATAAGTVGCGGGSCCGEALSCCGDVVAAVTGGEFDPRETGTDASSGNRNMPAAVAGEDDPRGNDGEVSTCCDDREGDRR